MGASERKGLHFGYLVVLTLVLTSFMPLSLGLSCQGIFYDSVGQHIGVGKGMMSYYASIIAATSFIFMPLLGNLMNRIDARICVAGAVIVSALAFVWLAFTESLWQFYTGGAIMGASVAMLLYLAPSTLVNRWFNKRSGFFVGLIMAFTGVGGVVWSTVGGALILSIGWSATYLIFAALSIATLPFAVFCISSSPQKKGLKPVGWVVADEAQDGLSCAVPGEEGVPAGRAFKMPAFFLIFAVAFLLNFGMYVYYVIPSYASTLEISVALPLLGATASSAAMAGQTISKLVLGAAGEKRPYVSAFAAVIVGLAGIFMLAIGGVGAALFYAGAFAFGIYYGVANVMLPIFTRRAFGVADYAKIYSRISMAATLGLTITGFIWGTLLDLYGFDVMFVGIAAFLAAACLLIAVLWRMSRARPQAASTSQPLR